MGQNRKQRGKERATEKSISGKPTLRKKHWESQWGETCPTSPSHGVLLDTEGEGGQPLLMCPHQQHARDLTRYFWTSEELRDARMDTATTTVGAPPPPAPGPGKRKIGAPG